MRYFFQVNDTADALRCTLGDGETREFKTADEFRDFLSEYAPDEKTVSVSWGSSLNWPREDGVTSNELIQFCNELTGNTIE